MEDVQTYVGDISVPFATIDLAVFAGQPLTPFSLGILSDTQNPLDENILGTDVLSGFDEFDFNVLLGKFEAVPTPEPSSLVLLLTAIGALGIAALGRRSGWSQVLPIRLPQPSFLTLKSPRVTQS